MGGFFAKVSYIVNLSKETHFHFYIISAVLLEWWGAGIVICLE